MSDPELEFESKEGDVLVKTASKTEQSPLATTEPEDTETVSREGKDPNIGIGSKEGPDLVSTRSKGDHPIVGIGSKEREAFFPTGVNEGDEAIVGIGSKELEDYIRTGSNEDDSTFVIGPLDPSKESGHGGKEGVDPFIGFGSKEGQSRIACTGSKGVAGILQQSKEGQDHIKESKVDDRVIENESKGGKLPIGGESKEWHSILKLQSKSQKSQLLMSDTKIGSGKTTKSLSVCSQKSPRSTADSLKEGTSQLHIELQPKPEPEDGSHTKSAISLKSAKSQLQQSQTRVEHFAVTSTTRSNKNQKSQLLISDSRPGLQPFVPLTSHVSETKVGSKEGHSILTVGSKSDQSGSDERFLNASAQNSDIMDNYHKPSPFSTRWVRGYNCKVPVINLNKQGSTILFYAAVNFGILYNWTTNSMIILEGHKHMVTNIAADADARWFVTADSGPENIITIWSAETYYPQRTIFAPHGAVKLAKVALSADAKYLLSLAYTDKACINFWIWSFGLDAPHASLQVDIPSNGVVSMGFNPENSHEFLLMTKQDIWFGVSVKIFALERGEMKETDDYELKIRCPPKKLAGIDPGSFTCYTFVANTSQVLVATSKGAVLVYGYNMNFIENVNGDELSFENLIFVKLVKVEKHRINSINSIDDVLVMGNSLGEIRFYDEHLLLKYWVHGFRPDSVRGLSFNLSPRSYRILDPKCKSKCFCWERVVVELDPLTGVARQKLMMGKLPTDATTAGRPFLVRDFVLNTHNQGISFVDFATEVLHPIVDCKISPALSIDVHPEKPFLVIGYADGLIELFNFVQHHLFVRVDARKHYTVETPPKPDSTKCASDYIVPEYSITCLKYSPSGLHLACGLNTGEIIFLDPTTITILTVKPHSDTSHSIQEINYSPDSKKLATADVGKTVCLYSYDCSIPGWVFVGKHRAHYKDIATVFFTPEQNADGNYKLISLGMDRVMVEYDVGASRDECLEIHSLDRVEQAAVPLCGLVWPNDTTLNPEHYRTDIPMLLFANDENKYKVLNYQTTMTLSVTLGPRYDTPVCRVKLVTGTDGDGNTNPYLMFATKTVIGIHKMPLDGNPWKHVGIMGHPSQVTGWCFRDDLGTLFTIGVKDSCLVQWAAKFKSVDITTKRGGTDLDPYYCLVENGRPGWLFQEIRDLFYYVQILCQGTFSPAIRHVKDFIPIASLPDLMRALGYFPTEYEVENLIVEAMYKVNQRQASTEVDFEEFVKLYLNHRPAFGDSVVRVRNAFRNFARLERDSYVMSREEFLDVLSNNGEKFSRELSWYLLSILSGLSFEDRAKLQGDDFSFLPLTISYGDFVSQLLGIQDMESSDRYSIIESMGSGQTSSTSISTKWTQERR